MYSALRILHFRYLLHAVCKILYQAVNAGSAVHKILYQAVETGSTVYKILDREQRLESRNDCCPWHTPWRPPWHPSLAPPLGTSLANPLIVPGTIFHPFHFLTFHLTPWHPLAPLHSVLMVGRNYFHENLDFYRELQLLSRWIKKHQKNFHKTFLCRENEVWSW